MNKFWQDINLYEKSKRNKEFCKEICFISEVLFCR